MLLHGTNLPLPVGTRLDYRSALGDISPQSLPGAVYYTDTEYSLPPGSTDGTVKLFGFTANTPDSSRQRAISSAVTYGVRAVQMRGISPRSLSLAASHRDIVFDEAGEVSDNWSHDDQQGYERVLRNRQLFGLDTSHVISDEEWAKKSPAEQNFLNDEWPESEVKPLRGYWVYEVKLYGTGRIDKDGQHFSDRYTKEYLKIVDIVINDGVFVNKADEPVTHNFIIPEMTPKDQELIFRLKGL